MPRDLLANIDYDKKDLLQGISSDELDNDFPTIADFSKDAAKGALGTLAAVGPGFANLGSKTINALLGTQIPDLKPAYTAPDTAGSRVGSLLGAIPLFMSGEGAADSLSELPAVANRLGKLSSPALTGLRVGKNVGLAGLTGAVLSPENQDEGALVGMGAGGLGSLALSENPYVNLASRIAGGAGVGGYITQSPFGALAGGVAGGVSGIPAAKQSFNRLLQGTATPEELVKNLAAARGTKTNLGRIIKNPNLARYYENKLYASPFSGVSSQMSETQKILEGRAKGLLQKLLGDHNQESIQQHLNDFLEKRFKEERGFKNDIYDAADKAAQKENFSVDPQRFKDSIQEHLDALRNSKFMDNEPNEAKIIKKLGLYKEGFNKDADSPILSASGEPFKKQLEPLSLKEASLLKGRLNDYAFAFNKDPAAASRLSAGVFGRLASSLRDDIHNSLDSSASPSLRTLHKNAEKNYEENFSPFLDKDVYKFATGNQDSDQLLSSFIKSNGDRGNLIKKILERYPQDKRDLFSHAYLKNAVDEDNNVNLGTLSTLIRRLGPEQKKALFPNKTIRDNLNNLHRGIDMNERAIHLMLNPRTGFSTIKSRLNPINPIISRYLTSESRRNKIVNQMLKDSKKNALLNEPVKP